MLRFSLVRVGILLVYFSLCSACGKPNARPPQPPAQQGSTSTATDINYLGGGSQVPEPAPREEPYRSPFIHTPPEPTALAWVSDVNAAIRVADRDRRYKIMLWFRSDDCVDCVNIERDVFTDPEVAKAGDMWLFVKMDIGTNPDRAQYYLHGADPPALVALDKQGHEFNRYYGTFTRDDLVTMLKTW